MRVIIIEDEEKAAVRLEKLLSEIDSEIEVVAFYDSVETSVEKLNNGIDYDIIFMDINLADGSSFEIFNQTIISKPIVFITAYDEYAVQAFKVNAIDYILKPVKKNELEVAYEKARQISSSDSLDYHKLAKAFHQSENTKRFLVKIGQQIKVIETDQAAYFYTRDKVTFVITKEGKRYPLDHSLEKLETILEPRTFFRINRQFIINIHAILEMFAYSKSRIKILLQPPSEIETIVSTERSPHFKKWLIGEY